jgi:hypothetical protein
MFRHVVCCSLLEVFAVAAVGVMHMSSGVPHHTGTATSAVASPSPPAQAAGYKLVFSEDFDTHNLSPTGDGNYTWYKGIWWEKPPPAENISIANSVLELNWRKGQTPDDTSITTLSRDIRHSRFWRYGYFEFCMRWDTVPGSWPAIWLMPLQNANTNSAKEAGELDIFEGQGSIPHTFYGTIHDWIDGKDAKNNKGSNYYQVSNAVDLSQYHVYGLLWVPGRVTWYLDNQALFSASTYPVFDVQDYYLIIASQEGENWTYGDMSGVTSSKITVNVDWARVWQIDASVNRSSVHGQHR